MMVTLLAYTPNPEQTVACAAKLCYSPATIGTLRDGLTQEKTTEFLELLSELGHQSPIEHAVFTFGIEGVSRSLLAQLTRHRIASYSVKSQRYVSEGTFTYVTPPAIAASAEANAIFEDAMARDQLQYDLLCAVLSEQREKELLAQGEKPEEAKKKAKKLAQEDARFVLPNACTTNLVMTMNARSLYNFFAERCCMRAQWEIRELAEQMLQAAKEVAPHLFAQAGPPCLNGPCPEGRMSCGKAAQVRDHYRKGRE